MILEVVRTFYQIIFFESHWWCDDDSEIKDIDFGSETCFLVFGFSEFIDCFIEFYLCKEADVFVWCDA